MSGHSLPRILVVEDDETFRDTVAEVLRDVGYKVRGARSLRKANKRLTHHTFDLVLTDVHLGDDSGLEVVQLASKTHPNAKVVLMSAAADPDTIQQALDSGAARFLPKPFRVKELLKTIEELLSEEPEPDKDAGPDDSAQ